MAVGRAEVAPPVDLAQDIHSLQLTWLIYVHAKDHGQDLPSCIFPIGCLAYHFPLPPVICDPGHGAEGLFRTIQHSKGDPRRRCQTQIYFR